MDGTVLAAMLNSTLPCEPWKDSWQNGTSIARELFKVSQYSHNKYETLSIFQQIRYTYIVSTKWWGQEEGRSVD